MASLLLVGSPGCALLLLSVCSRFKISETVNEIVFLVAAASFLVSPILAIAALVAIWKSHGKLTGRGVAITSLVIAIAMIVVPMVCPVPGRGRPGNSIRCVGNLKHIQIALDAYYYDNDDRYPPSLSCLYPKYINDLSDFQCPSAKSRRMTAKFDEQLCSYRYIYYPDESVKLFDVDRAVLAFDKGVNQHMEGMNAVFVDGSVIFFSREKFIVMLGGLAGNKKLSMPTRDSVLKVLTEVLAEAPLKHKSP